MKKEISTLTIALSASSFHDGESYNLSRTGIWGPRYVLRALMQYQLFTGLLAILGTAVALPINRIEITSKGLDTRNSIIHLPKAGALSIIDGLEIKRPNRLDTRLDFI